MTGVQTCALPIFELPDPDVLPSLEVSSLEICDPVISSEIAVRNSPVIGPGTFHNETKKEKKEH